MKKEDGYAVVLAFIMLLILMIILTAAFSLVSSEINFVSHSKESIKTFYTAEAGLEYAGSLLSNSDLTDTTIWNSNELSSEYLTKVNNIVVNNITLDKVEKNESGNKITLKSTAIHDSGVEKVIEVTYKKNYTGSNFSNYSIVSNGDIDIKNKVKIVGLVDDDYGDLDGDGIPNIDDPDAYDYYDDLDGDGIPNIDDPDADGDGILNIDDPDYYGFYDSSPDFYGDIYTTASVTEKSKTELINSSVSDGNTDDIVPDMYADIYSQFQEEIDDPDSYEDFYKDQIPQKNGNYVFDNDIVYSSTNLEFKNGDIIQGNGLLLVNGDIDFKNGVDISTGENENLLIIASGNITFNNSSNFSGMVYAGGTISIKAKVDIKGSILSKIAIEEDAEETTVSINNGGNDPSEIVYDNSYLEVFNTLNIEVPSLESGSSDYDLYIINWKE